MVESLTRITQLRLINLRWLSIAAMAVAALVSPNILGSHELIPRLLAFSCLIASANACLLFATLFHKRSDEGIPRLTPWIQLLLDLTAWSVFIYLSGGATNPLISVFLPLVAIGAMTLDRLYAWLFGLLAIFAYSFLWRYHVPLAINDAQKATYLHLLGMWLVFGVSTIVSIWFIQRMREAIGRRDKTLAEAREAALWSDWLISLGTVAAGAAHEMSTPLATVNVLVDDWMDDPTFPPAFRGDLELLGKQVESCRTTLNQLASRALPSSKSVGASTEVWIKGLIGAWHGMFPSANIELNVGQAPGSSAPSIDVTLERAITNVLDNAYQSGAKVIAVRTGISGKCLVIDVADNGPGISDEALKCFQLGQPVFSDKGLGIGLAISKASVERCGGKLCIERNGNCGTLVQIRVPLQAEEGFT